MKPAHLSGVVADQLLRDGMDEGPGRGTRQPHSDRFLVRGEEDGDVRHAAIPMGQLHIPIGRTAVYS